MDLSTWAKVTSRVPGRDKPSSLPFFKAVTEGKIRVEQEFTDPSEVDLAKEGTETRAPSEAAAEASHASVGEDDVLVWYLRCVKGVEADARRRRTRGAWSWWLVRHGYTDDEIEAAMLSHCAGEPLAWLARIRGLDVTDHMVEAATEELASSSGKLVKRGGRNAAVKRWSGRSLEKEPDLAAVVAALRAELGSRPLRVSTLVAISREHGWSGGGSDRRPRVVGAAPSAPA